MSDAIWAILALEASKTVVGAMTTSVWEQAKRSFCLLFGREGDGGTLAVAKELEKTRADLERARESGEVDTFTSVTEARWQGRVEALFDLDADAVARIRAFVEEYSPSITKSEDLVSQRIDVRDDGIAFIVGKGTQHIYRH
jgi:hypothetical protein